MNSFLEHIQWFESQLNSFLKNYEKDPFYEHLVYATEGGGKRIRPLLAILVAEAFDTPKEEVLPIALAIELVHSYSLVHDDLPAMDNDDERRGKPSMHKKYGEGIAVLVGDALLNLAYEVLLQSLLHNKNSKHIKGYAAFSRFCGVGGMVGGQYIDITDTAVDKPTYLDMYAKKTSALLQAATVAAAYLSGACKKEINAISKYAYNLGIAFQIKDDLLESEQGLTEQNIISTVGITRAEKLCEDFTRRSIDALKNINNNHNLIKIANILLGRKF